MFRSGGRASRGDLYIRFKIDFPRKLTRSLNSESDDAKKSLEELRRLLGQKSQNDGTNGGLFSSWWNAGGGAGDKADAGSSEKPLIAHRASAGQERALAAAEQRQTSERERTEGF